MTEKRKCPKCRAAKLLPIMYGYPMEEALEGARRGEIMLGGCVVHGNDPQWGCAACGTRFLEDDGGGLLPSEGPWGKKVPPL